MTENTGSRKISIGPELHHRIVHKMVECLNKAKQVWGNRINRVPDLRLETYGRAAGKSHINYVTGERYINLNPILLVENQDYFFKQTIPHEMAHQIVYMVFGPDVKAHGKEWKTVMKVLGCEPNRCHTLDVTKVQSIRKKVERKWYICYCPRCNQKVNVSSVMYNRMLRYNNEYSHKLCGGRISFELF